MGLSLAAKPGPIPREIALALTCDGDHGLLQAPTHIFQDAPFPDLFHAAMEHGWKETYGLTIRQVGKLSIARLFLCPECSGKPRQLGNPANNEGGGP